MLNLDPYCFDQSESGWRSLSDEMKIIEVIKQYIDKYVDGRTFKESVPPNETNDDMHLNYPITLLYWHLGQYYALNNDNKNAKEYMLQAKRLDEDGQHWNQYVDATIAFLNNDREALETSVNYPDKEENYNLHVLESLIENFGKPYREVWF